MTRDTIFVSLWERSWFRGATLTARLARRGVRFHPTARLRGPIASFVLSSGTRISERCLLAVSPGGRFDIGHRVWMAADCHLESSTVLSIGEGTTLQRRTSLIGSISIGARCILAPNVFISSGEHPFARWPHLPIREQERFLASDADGARDRPITIGGDCWLGANAVVMPGVTIGAGSIIGANAVVTTDVTPYTVVAGVPARIIRTRLDWEPPRSLDATSATAVPYLLDGFSIAYGSLPTDAITVLCGQSSRLVLARPLEEERVAITVRLQRAGRLVVAGTATTLPLGEHTVRISLELGTGPAIVDIECDEALIGTVQLVAAAVENSTCIG